MNKLLLIFLFAITLVTFSFCKKDDTSSVEDSQFFTAKIDGTEFEAEDILALNAGFFFQVSGTGSTGNMAFNINVVPPNPGVYEFGTSDLVGSFDMGSDGWSAKSGTLTITRYEDGIIEGKFEFFGENTLGLLDPDAPDINVTEGNFRAKYL